MEGTFPSCYSLGTLIQNFEQAHFGAIVTLRCILSKTARKKISIPYEHGISRVIEDILGCKWTVVVLRSIAGGVHRPGALTKRIPGLSPKVLNERLRKLLRYSIISREVFNEIPPKVEYRLTPLGKRISKVLSDLEKIEAELSAD